MLPSFLFFILGDILLFYTDPGSGALILQLIAGAVLGGLFYLRKIKTALFKKRSSDESKDVEISSR
jgi:hypothetical protein